MSQLKQFLLITVFVFLTLTVLLYISIVDRKRMFLIPAHLSVQRVIYYYSEGSLTDTRRIFHYHPRQVWLVLKKKFIDRLTVFNFLVTMGRDKLLSRNETLTLPTVAKYVYSNPTNYLYEFSNRSDILAMTIYLQFWGLLKESNSSISHDDAKMNFMVTQYYLWNGTSTFCQLLRTGGHSYLWNNPCGENSISYVSKPSYNLVSD